MIIDNVFVPKCLLLQIFDDLNPQELARCREVCKAWKNLIDANSNQAVSALPALCNKSIWMLLDPIRKSFNPNSPHLEIQRIARDSFFSSDYRNCFITSENDLFKKTQSFCEGVPSGCIGSLFILFPLLTTDNPSKHFNTYEKLARIKIKFYNGSKYTPKTIAVREVYFFMKEYKGSDYVDAWYEYCAGVDYGKYFKISVKCFLPSKKITLKLDGHYRGNFPKIKSENSYKSVNMFVKISEIAEKTLDDKLAEQVKRREIEKQYCSVL